MGGMYDPYPGSDSSGAFDIYVKYGGVAVNGEGVLTC